MFYGEVFSNLFIGREQFLKLQVYVMSNYLDIFKISFLETEVEGAPEVESASTSITKNILEIEIAKDTGSPRTKAQGTRRISFRQRISSINDQRKFSSSW